MTWQKEKTDGTETVYTIVAKSRQEKEYCKIYVLTCQVGDSITRKDDKSQSQVRGTYNTSVKGHLEIKFERALVDTGQRQSRLPNVCNAWIITCFVTIGY